MRYLLLFTITWLSLQHLASAQTFNGSGGPIHDLNGTPQAQYFPCVVSGLPNSIDSSTFGLERICLDITHTYTNDLRLQLMSPDSLLLDLCNRHGGGGDNFTGTCFRGMSVNGMISATGNIPPYTGEYDPDQDMALFNNGQDPNGTWFLVVTDMAGADSGTVDTWSLTFGSDPTPHGLEPCNMLRPALCICPDGTQDCDLLPDMTASEQAILDGSYERNDTLFVNNATPNIGWGPLEIHGTGDCYCDTVPVNCSITCPDGSSPKEIVQQTVYHKSFNTMTSYVRQAGTMAYHPQHGHIHLDGWAEYTLRKAWHGKTPQDWPVIGTGNKQSYCLVNLGQCTAGNGYCVDTTGQIRYNANIANYGLGSVTGCSRDQGIFVGSLDIYSASLYGQWIILDSVCNGDYYIVSITDPNNWILETDDSNNWAAAPFSLTGQLNAPFPTVNFTYSATGSSVQFTSTCADFDSLSWDFGDGDTSTALNPLHTYASTGTYEVVLTAFNHCGWEQQVQSFTITVSGLEAIGHEDLFGLRVFPNPSSTAFNIDFSTASRTDVRLELLDIMGRPVSVLSDQSMAAGSHRYRLDVESGNLKAGVYFLRVQSDGVARLVRLVVAR